jgi:secreted trypsin-like serine protease
MIGLNLQNHSRSSNQLQFQLAFQIAMKLLIIAFALFFVISAEADSDQIEWSRVLPPMEVPGFWESRPELKKLFYSNRGGRIVGGQEVTPNSIPHQAALIMLNENGGSTICGGSLVTTRTVLTAAHCVRNAVTTQVILGAHNRHTVESSQQRETVTAANTRIHELFAPNLDEDIALLILQRTAQINEFVQTVALPTNYANEDFAGEDGTISGWGRISDDTGANSSILRAVTVPVLTNEVCRQTFWGITERRICTSGVGGRGSCFGDSGGPLTIQRDGVTIQIGIASFVAAAGCELGTPSGKWIEVLS